MNRFSIALFALFFVIVASASAIDSGPVRIGDNFDIKVTYGDGTWSKSAEGFHWQTVISHRGAGFIRLHFSDFDLADGEYVLISDPEGHKALRYEGRGFKNLKNFWAGTIHSDSVLVEFVTRNLVDKSALFLVDQYSAGTQSLQAILESCASSPDYENLLCATRPSAVLANANKVGHIVFQEGSGSYVCTGSLISANSHFLTNEHCMAGAQTQCNTYEVYFDYETSSSQSCTYNYASKGTAYSCDQFLTKNACYDYALCTLSNSPANTYGFLELDPNGVTTTATNLYIIGHPAGYPKKVMGLGNGSNDVNEINVDPIFPESCSGGETDSEVEYEILSQGGSSGSPVFNESTHKVVALHHAGWNCDYSEQGWGINMKKVYPEISPYLGGTPPAGNELQVTVNITHTYIGDLTVTLYTPSSQTVTLHNKEGGSADNIHTTYNVTGWDGDYQGYWTLKVTDTYNADTGTLDSWSVSATPDGGSTHNGSATDTPIAIPDNNTTGITSSFYMY